MKSQLKELADFIRTELSTGNEVNLPGVGKFSVVDRAARVGRNPATGEELQIPAKKAVKFKSSVTLKRDLNV